jgi:hypothetical protein
VRQLFGGNLLEFHWHHRMRKLPGGNEPGAHRCFYIVCMFRMRKRLLFGRKCWQLLKLRSRVVSEFRWRHRLHQLCFWPVYLGDGF